MDYYNGFYFYYYIFASLFLYRLVLYRRKYQKLFLVLAFLQFFIVLALRAAEVGPDAGQYRNVYVGAREMSFMELLSRWNLLHQMLLPNGWRAESGYATLNWIFGHLLGLPYRVYIIALAAFCSFTLYKYFNRHTHTPLLAAMVAYNYLLTAYITLLKRTTALNFVLWAYMAMEDKKYKKAFGLLCIAMTMHRTAVLLFLFLPLSKVKITKPVIKKIIIITFLISLVAKPLANMFIPLVLKIFDKYGSGDSWVGSGTELKALFGIAALFAIYLLLDIRIIQTHTNNFLCWLFLFVIMFSPLQAVIPLLGNIYMYFTPHAFLFLTNLIVQRREDSYIKRGMLFITFAILVVLFHMHITSDAMLIRSYAYRPVWEAKKNWDY